MKYNPKVIMIALAIAILLVLVIGTISHGLNSKHDSAPPVADSTPLTKGNHSGEPIPDSTEAQECPIPPIKPNDPVTPARPEQADVEFHIRDHRPNMNPSAGTGEVEYDTKEVERNA